jgi:transcriptional regulator of nitric oxide reductase
MKSQERQGSMITRIIVTLMFLSVIPTFISSSSGQSFQTVAAEEGRLLKEVFPQASVFSTKGGDLPHHKAYQTNPETGANTLVGFVFLCTDVVPDEFGYAAEIDILIGMTTEGVITRIKMVDHIEPYGYFSIDPAKFASQFWGKSILERFDTGRDINAVTGATITVDGAARVIRKSARQIARKYFEREQSQR